MANEIVRVKGSSPQELEAITNDSDGKVVGIFAGEPVYIDSPQSYFFKNVAGRDAYFGEIPNLSLLRTDTPVIVNQGNTITTYFWDGVDAPVSYDPDLWRTASLNSGAGTLFLGQGGASISSGNHVLNFIDTDAELSYVLDVKYDDTGSFPPVIFDLAAISNSIVADVFDSTLSDPQDMQILAASDIMTRAYGVRPATTGTLRTQAWAGTVDTGPVILDVLTTVGGGDIGNILTIDLPNPILTLTGDDILVRFSGVQLDGGLQTSGLFNGQTVPYLEADLHVSTTKEIAISGEVISADPRNLYFAKGGDDSKAGTTLENANLTIGESITKVNALSPPPSTINPSAVISIGFGSYSENITIPPGCELSAPNSLIQSSSGATVTMGSNSVVKAENIASIASSGDAVLINASNGLSVNSRIITALGTAGNCIRVTGNSSKIFVNTQRLIVDGSGAAGIFDESSSDGTRIYNIDEIALEANSTIGVFFDPTDLSASGIFNIGSIREATGATNTTAVDIIGGKVTMTVNDINADTAITVETGGTLNITASKIVGDIIVNGTGVLNAQVIEHTGNIIIAATATGNVTGRLGSTEFSDQAISGSLTASGVIEGSL